MIDLNELERARQTVLDDLLALRDKSGHWVGHLCSSPLSTATAVSALSLVDRHAANGPRHRDLIQRAVGYLAEAVKDDGGWGDTDRSRSNLATTMLVRAAFELAGATESHSEQIGRAEAYIDREGRIEGLGRRYGKDNTFAVPILTNCALAGLVPWSQVAPLPFELACSPHWLLRFLRLPVVSYALPALVAIGQARWFHLRPRNPLTRLVRHGAVGPSIKKLRAMQPTSGGYLEATPLTSFVVMSLAATGRAEHAVTRDGVRFLRESVRDDGSWPIDTNLATWNTTLAVNAMPTDALDELGDDCVEWLLQCQHRAVHPFTRAAAGGWGWTDLSGAVPDADDTAGALLALARVADRPVAPRLHLDVAQPRAAMLQDSSQPGAAMLHAVGAGVDWLLGLQNGDGGWPTFCRGWGALPFDRSGADLTAHALRALHAWRPVAPTRIDRAIHRGFGYLEKVQCDDGRWTPLWFGNENEPGEENPIHGTSRVLSAYRDLGRTSSEPARRGEAWLASRQNADGGWGGNLRDVSSVEETAVAVEALLAGREAPSVQVAVEQGLAWLCRAVAEGRHREGSPIGLYFAKLWYHERTYPLVFTLSALSRAVERFSG